MCVRNWTSKKKSVNRQHRYITHYSHYSLLVLCLECEEGIGTSNWLPCTNLSVSLFYSPCCLFYMNFFFNLRVISFFIQQCFKDLQLSDIQGASLASALRVKTVKTLFPISLYMSLLSWYWSISKLFEWLFSGVLASHRGGPGSIPGRNISVSGPLVYDGDDRGQVTS